MMIDLSRRIALVTGASGNLGRVISRTLAACGADVALHYYHNFDKAKAVCKELDASGVRSLAVQADVTDAESVRQMQQRVARDLGEPDIVVNNAVIQYAWTNVLEQALADYESQFRSCVLHNVLMAKAFVPAMISKRWGRLIAISTECAVQCSPSQSAYASGKRGMDGVLRVLAREIGEHQITVNQVAPGWMITDRDRVAGTAKQPQYEAKIPLRRRGQDQDIAHCVAFLASDFAAYITGSYIPVCGGNVMPLI